MAELSPERVYLLARDAGFSASQAVTMTAIAMGESELETANVGDQGLVTAHWGPSLGLWQIRSLTPSAYAHASGADKYRDRSRLLDPSFNAAAAYAISGQGKTFQPWSVYTSGKYRQYLGRARAAAANVGSGLLGPVPGAKVTTPFGKSGPRWSSGQHTGDDYAVASGTKVYAAASGEVIAAGPSSGPYGTRVQVRSSSGVTELYAHLSAAKVREGTRVVAGQLLGLSGATGNVTGPHVHYEVRKDGTAVEPSSVINPTTMYVPAGFLPDVPGLGRLGDAAGRAAGGLGGLAGDVIPWLAPVPSAIGGEGGPLGAISEGAAGVAGDVATGVATGVGNAAKAVFSSSEMRDFAVKGGAAVLGLTLILIAASKVTAPARAKAGEAAGKVAGAAAAVETGGASLAARKG